MNIRSDRPRIFISEAHINYLRTPEAQARPQWQRLLQWCEDGWNLPAGTKGRDQYHANNYGLVYAVTGSERHGRKAIALCEIYFGMGMEAMTKVGATSSHGFGARIVLPEVACTYDWCYPLLSAAEHNRWEDQMIKWADWCWLETNPDKPSEWGQHNPGDNFFHGFMMTGLIGLAIGSDHPRGEAHARLAFGKWNMMWRPYLERYGSGTSLEGTAYGTWKLLSFLIAAYKSAAGDDLDGTRFMDDAAEGRIHLTAPGWKKLAPLGGQPSDASAPITDYHRTLMLVTMSYHGPTVAGCARDWLDRVPPSRWRWTAWEEALWYDPRVQPVKAETLPTTFYAPGAGVIAARTSWEADATWLIYECGPTLESHQDLGAGQFHFYTNGDWITTNARLWGHGGGLHPTEFTNSIRVGGKDQPGVDTNRILPKDIAGKILSVEDTGGTLEIDSEFPRAYDYKSGSKALPRLTEARRRLLWIKPNWILIRDKFTRVNPADELVLMIHCNQAPLISSQFGFGIQRHNKPTAGVHVMMDGQVIAPENYTLRAVEIRKGPRGALSSWRLEIVIPGGSPTVEVAWLLEIDE